MHTIHQLPFENALALIEESVRKASPIKGSVRVVSIDGPAGAGKSTMATHLARNLEDAPVVHMDDLYRGWSDALTSQLTATLKDQILTPISLGKRGGYRSWDWLSNRPGEIVSIPEHPFLILEGVGASQRIVRPFVGTMVWIDIDPKVGLDRVIERDRRIVADMTDFIRQMQDWQVNELLHFERERTFDAAHLRFDGSRFT